MAEGGRELSRASFIRTPFPFIRVLLHDLITLQRLPSEHHGTLDYISTLNFGMAQTFGLLDRAFKKDPYLKVEMLPNVV